MESVAYVFYYYLIDLLKLWLILWGIVNFTVIKKWKRYAVTGIVESGILIIASFYYNQYSDTIIMIMTGMVLFTVCLFFKGKFFKKLAYSLLIYIFVLFLDACVTGLISSIISSSYDELFDDDVLRFLCNSISVIIIGVIVLIKKNRNKSAIQIGISKRIYVLLFSGAGSGILILSSLMAVSVNGIYERTRQAMIVVTIIVCISYGATCLMIIFITESRDNFKALSLINQSIIESQQKYYMMVLEKQEEMRSIRHEIRNHLACIQGLYKANKLSELEQYLSQLVEEAENSKELFETGNGIVNAILNDAQSKIQKEMIAIRVEGGFPEELNIAPMDLCVIFANVISNAVEAIQLIEPRDIIRYIDVKISSFKSDLYIDIKNPITKK